MSLVSNVGQIRVTVVPCLSDNYAYLVECTETGRRAVIDPSDAGPVLVALGTHSLDAIWCTHHHFDHVGGNAALISACRPKEVCGHESEASRIPGFTRGLRDGETFRFGGLDVEVKHVPGHTLGAVAFVIRSGAGAALFSGDTLFLAGCGRLFEGTKEQMLASFDRLAELPDDTFVFPGHEYTENNLRFADTLGFSDLLAPKRRVEGLRRAGKPSVPGTLREERVSNPFLNVDNARLRQHLGMSDASRADVFGEVRKRKDRF